MIDILCSTACVIALYKIIEAALQKTVKTGTGIYSEFENGASFLEPSANQIWPPLTSSQPPTYAYYFLPPPLLSIFSIQLPKKYKHPWKY